MFVSFFPRPKLFFWSAVVWTALSMALWYGYVNGLTESTKPGVVGVALFWSAPSLLFDLYFVIAVAIFAGFWMTLAPHPVGEVVHPRIGTDPVHLLLPGSGQRRHQ